MLIPSYTVVTAGLNSLKDFEGEKLAQLSSLLFDEILVRSGAVNNDAATGAQKVAAYVLGLRETHEMVQGVKLAADGALISDALVKLSTAVYLDTNIKTAELRMLNREFAINIIRGLLD